MKSGDKVKLRKIHPQYESYKNLTWTVDFTGRDGTFGFLVTKNPMRTSYATGDSLMTSAYESELIFVNDALWECFNCDLLLEDPSNTRPSCPECGNLMSESKREE